MENRTNDIRRYFDMIRTSKHDVEEERDKLNEIIHLDQQEGPHLDKQAGPHLNQ